MKSPQQIAKENHRRRVTRVLRGVQKSIRKYPEHFNMKKWMCETTACIAGWIVENDLARRKKKAPKFVPGEVDHVFLQGISVPRQAKIILGMGFDLDLFYISAWPSEFWLSINKPEGLYHNEITADIACQYIDFWLANVLEEKLSAIYDSPPTPTNVQTKV